MRRRSLQPIVILILMLSRYLAAAMSHATYELLDDGTFYGEVPPLAGVYANANTLEACREELAEVLEGWVLLGVSMRHPIPPIDGVEITVGQVA